VHNVSVPDVVDRELSRRTDSVNELLGDLLRELRDQRGMTQSEVADRAKISRGSIANIERGDQGTSVTLLLRLVEALEADVGVLMTTLQERVRATEDSDDAGSGLEGLLDPRELRWVLKPVAENTK
jgi:transcriptional regulator with XRE-family HTH domain